MSIKDQIQHSAGKGGCRPERLNHLQIHLVNTLSNTVTNTVTNKNRKYNTAQVEVIQRPGEAATTCRRLEPTNHLPASLSLSIPSFLSTLTKWHFVCMTLEDIFSSTFLNCTHSTTHLPASHQLAPTYLTDTFHSWLSQHFVCNLNI